MENERINEIIEKYNSDKSALISILYEIQMEDGYLNQEVLKSVANSLEISITQLFGIVTFCKIFRLEPSGEHTIRVCLGTACHVRGAPKILEEFERHLNIKTGETTKDLMFTLDKVNCLGCCALGPVVLVDNGNYYGQMTQAKVASLIKKLRQSRKK